MLYIIGIHVYMELTGVYMCNKLQTLIDAGNCYDVQYVYWNTRHVNKINSVYALYQGQRFHIFIERSSIFRKEEKHHFSLTFSEGAAVIFLYMQPYLTFKNNLHFITLICMEICP